MRIKNKWIETAKRIYNLDLYESQDHDETPENIAAQMVQNPLDVFNYLLDIIDYLATVIS